MQQWLATELRAALEPPLARAPGQAAATVYRMTTLGGWGGMTSLRIEQQGDQWRVVRKVTRTGPKGWQDPMRIVSSADSVLVPLSRVRRVIAVVEASHYWRDPAPTCRNGLDGWELLLEARIKGEVYALVCWVPERTTAPTVVASMEEFERLASALFPAVSAHEP